MLTLDLLAKIVTTIGLFCFGSISGAYTMMVNFLILVAANIKERKNQRWMIVFILFVAVDIAIMILRFEGISTVLVFITSIVSLISIWWLPPQQMRIAGLFCCAAYFAYQMTIKNWVGFAEIIVFASNLISYMKYKESASE